jgi:uncharacterized protein
MRVAITGASGLVGAALAEHLRQAGHSVIRLVRDAGAAQHRDACWWEPQHGIRQPEKLYDADGFVHLAGRGIADARWTAREKQLLRESRVDATRLLCDQLASLPRVPKVFISASAIGYYGDCGAAEVDESAPPASDFLGEMARDWEAATLPLEVVETRVAHARLAVVLTPHGGALAKMLPIFRWGLGGPLGSGQQYWSWITLDDVVRGLEWLLTRSSCRGAYNFSAPEPVTNAEFTRALARTVHRPAWLPAPRFGLRLAMGEMADAALLSSCRAVPARLLSSGFEFHHPQLDSALADLLN